VEIKCKKNYNLCPVKNKKKEILHAMSKHAKILKLQEMKLFCKVLLKHFACKYWETVKQQSSVPCVNLFPESRVQQRGWWPPRAPPPEPRDLQRAIKSYGWFLTACSSSSSSVATLCRGACVEVDSNTEAVAEEGFKLGCISCKRRGEVEATAFVKWSFRASTETEFTDVSVDKKMWNSRTARRVGKRFS